MLVVAGHCFGVCSLCQCTVLHHMWLCHAHCLLCLACFVCSACSHCVGCVWFEQQQPHTPGLQQAHHVVVCSLHIAPTSLLSMCFINHPSSLLLACLFVCCWCGEVFVDHHTHHTTGAVVWPMAQHTWWVWFVVHWALCFVVPPTHLWCFTSHITNHHTPTVVFVVPVLTNHTIHHCCCCCCWLLVVLVAQ